MPHPKPTIDPTIQDPLAQDWHSRVIDRPRLEEPYRHREAA